MSGLVENFIRRVEKTLSTSPTVPPPGTNHVDDNWLNTDIYPGELAVVFPEGNLYTSDGSNIIDLGKEDALLSGMEVSKDTSGVNKLTVSSGSVRINGITYLHSSSGTDMILPFNNTSTPCLYFIYAQGASSDTVGLTYSSLFGNLAEPGGIFSAVAATAGNPASPQDSILLGTVLVMPGATGYELSPLSVASLGDYYPKFSVTPSEFLRNFLKINSLYSTSHLYFPGQIIVDNTSNTEYLTKKTFISNFSSIAGDVTSGNVVLLSGGTGGTGSPVTYSATNIGAGPVGVYQSTVLNQFRFRTIYGSGSINVGYTGSGNNSIILSVNPTSVVTTLLNVGGGTQIYKGLTSTNIAQIRSLTAGSSKITIQNTTDEIIIDVPAIGTTAQGINLGATGDSTIYAGMSGDDLTFRRISFGTGMTFSQSANMLTISTTAKNNNGVNVGGGPGPVYGGMSGDNLIFRSITGGTNVTVSVAGETIVISASGGSASSTVGVNVGATGSTVGQPFKGMSGSDLLFRSIRSGFGLAITNVGDNIQIDSTITNGTQGAQGRQGAQGPQGLRGFQGFQGIIGPSGINGIDGNQGFQGPFGFQGLAGAQGAQGIAGTTPAYGPLFYMEAYDSGIGWTVPAGSTRSITFNTTRYADPIFSITQSSPPGTGTLFSFTENGRYLILCNVGFLAPVNSESKFTIYKAGAPDTDIVGTTVLSQVSGANPAKCAAVLKTVIDYTTGDNYGIRCFVNPATTTGSISGLAENSNITIIKLEGGKGVTGSQGVQGVQGNQGAQGLLGFQGSQGLQGPQSSLQGPQGFQGSVGVTGSGAQGPIGPQGFQGIDGTQGAQGPSGTGSQGSQGPVGPQGSALGTTGASNQILYYDTSGNLTASSNFTFASNTLTIGTSTSASLSPGTLSLNGARVGFSSSGVNGLIVYLGGTLSGAADQSKAFDFYNKGARYLTMNSFGITASVGNLTRNNIILSGTLSVQRNRVESSLSHGTNGTWGKRGIIFTTGTASYIDVNTGTTASVNSGGSGYYNGTWTVPLSAPGASGGWATITVIGGTVANVSMAQGGKGFMFGATATFDSIYAGTGGTGGVGSGAIINVFNASQGAELVAVSFDVPTFDAHTGATYSDFANVYIEGAPITGPSASFTGNSYALKINSGKTYMGGSLSIGGPPVSSAALSITSTTQGFLPPKMTGAQAEAITGLTAGILVYSTDGSGGTITTSGWWGYDGSTWSKLN